MSDMTLAELVAKLGVDCVDHTSDSVKMTLVQMGKLSEVLGEDVTPSGFLAKENRVIVTLDIATIEAAVVANKKAPRSSVNVEIETTTLYQVKANGVNSVTSANYNAAVGIGEIVINGVSHPVTTGKASDFYTDSDTPDRPVFVVVVVVAGERQTRFSYGFTNLIRQICGIRETIG